MNKKVILIQGLLAPYRYAIFEELSKILNSNFEVWLMGKSVKNRSWSEKELDRYNFKYRFLNGFTLNFGKNDNYPFWINIFIFPTLFLSKPDIVIMMGWDSFTSFIAHLYCKITKTKFILYSDSTPAETSWRRDITRPLVKLHVNTSDALICGGTKSFEYLKILGANPNKIFISFNTVDIEKYVNAVSKYRKYSDIIREKINSEGKILIMYYAQLIERKGADILLKAFMNLKKRYQDISLLLIGDGPYRNHLENFINRYGIKDVSLISNPGDDEVCRYYSIADIFVLPSREEVWGLVVNEAMASSIPVVVSDRAGCSEDLVVEKYNGFTFKSEDVYDLESKIELLVKDENLRKEMSANSLKVVRKFTPAVTVGKFIEAINSLKR